MVNSTDWNYVFTPNTRNSAQKKSKWKMKAKPKKGNQSKNNKLKMLK